MQSFLVNFRTSLLGAACEHFACGVIFITEVSPEHFNTVQHRSNLQPDHNENAVLHFLAILHTCQGTSCQEDF